jgi:citrate lyase subunit beta/citryl-CoA lyase
LDAQAARVRLPVCDHYSGVLARMEKSLLLQTQMIEDLGACVFDVTLDCEDGATVGAERDHAQLVSELIAKRSPKARVAARIHAVDHPHFEDDVDLIVGKVGSMMSHVMIPKVEQVADIQRVALALDRVGAAHLPIHALIESPQAVHQAFDIAAHPRVESLSFGLMDFVSAHAGAIPASGMTMKGQFEHPLIVRAKLEIASACHAHGKTPAHGVVTEINDLVAIAKSASDAHLRLGYTRMWSIHPSQIEPIIEAMSPSQDAIHEASAILLAAKAADWGPIRHEGRLHDRASFRYYWQVLERARDTARVLPQEVMVFFDSTLRMAA